MGYNKHYRHYEPPQPHVDWESNPHAPILHGDESDGGFNNNNNSVIVASNNNYDSGTIFPLLLLIFFVILSVLATLFYCWRKRGYPPMSLMCARCPWSEVKLPRVPERVTNMFDRIKALPPFSLPFSPFSNEGTSGGPGGFSHHSSNSISNNPPPIFTDGGFITRQRTVSENVEAVWNPSTNTNTSTSTNTNTKIVPVATVCPLESSMPTASQVDGNGSVTVKGVSNQVYDVVQVQVEITPDHQTDRKVKANGDLRLHRNPYSINNSNAAIGLGARGLCPPKNPSQTESRGKEESCEEPVYDVITEGSNHYETIHDLNSSSVNGPRVNGK